MVIGACESICDATRGSETYGYEERRKRQNTRQNTFSD